MKLATVINSLRNFRKWHRLVGLSIALFLLVSAVTGFLLGWKKDIALIQPPTQKGVTKELAEWKSMDELAQLAQSHFTTAFPNETPNFIDRIDVRPSKGIAKVLFKNGWWEVQIDGKTGQILSTGRRHSDWIEQLHDGSLISDGFKLFAMNFLGIGAFFIVCSGFWLWLGPIKFRDMKRESTSSHK